LDDSVFDLGKFYRNTVNHKEIKHPGGLNPLINSAGKDVSGFFHNIEKHKNRPEIFQLLQTFKVGWLIK